MSIPNISVLMGVYYRRNDCGLLRRSVDSILAQTFSDFELLICDDGSTSEAKELMEEYVAADSRVRLIRRDGKVDLAAKLNACLKRAVGKYIARMDDDDYSHPERFKRQIQALSNAAHEIAFVGSNVNLVRGGVHIGVRKLPKYPTVQDFYVTQPFIHPALMLRRDVLGDVGGYSEAARCVLCEDYDLLLRLYAKGYRGENLQDALLDYTVPLTAKGNRTMRHRWNETQTRYVRFRELGIIPGALPFVIKPLATGLIPESVLQSIKKHRNCG